jgi:hypothetical protein
VGYNHWNSRSSADHQATGVGMNVKPPKGYRLIFPSMLRSGSRIKRPGDLRWFIDEWRLVLFGGTPMNLGIIYARKIKSKPKKKA